MNIICTDKYKLDIDATRKQLNEWLKMKHPKFFEQHYNHIKPMIICEELTNQIQMVLFLMIIRFTVQMVSLSLFRFALKGRRKVSVTERFIVMNGRIFITL